MDYRKQKMVDHFYLNWQIFPSSNGCKLMKNGYRLVKLLKYFLPFYTAEKNFQLKQNDRYSETIAKCPEKRCKKATFSADFWTWIYVLERLPWPDQEFLQTMLWIFPDCGGSSLRKAWILPWLPCKVVKPFVVGKQSVFNFSQRILAGNLSKQQSQKLFPCGEMLAISVSAWLFYDFFKTISGNEVEKLRIDANVIHCSGFSC